MTQALADRIRALSLQAPWLTAQLWDIAGEVQKMERTLNEIVTDAQQDEILRKHALADSEANKVLPFRKPLQIQSPSGGGNAA